MMRLFANRHYRAAIVMSSGANIAFAVDHIGRGEHVAFNLGLVTVYALVAWAHWPQAVRR